MIYKKIIFVLSVILIGSLFSCGLANYNFNNSPNPATIKNFNADSTGVFNSPSGRLESSDTCSKNEDCKELCNSMLQRFSDQKKCYDHKEKEVQSFRDTYNLLALGNPRKLARVDIDEMKKFLTFGPKLWQDAIYGFERERKEDCTPNDGKDDPTEREDCKLKGYYKQIGYWSSGAASALEWIATNDWLAELIIDHDKDDEYVIMKSLLDVLANGGGRNFFEHPSDPQKNDRDRESLDNKNKTCNLALIEPDKDNDGSCNNVDGDDVEDEIQDNDDDLTDGDEDLKDDGSCNNNTDYHGRLYPQKAGGSAGLSLDSDLEEQYKAFGADCLAEEDRENYFTLAVERENRNSVILGHKVLVEILCASSSDDDKCIEYFYCRIKDGHEDTRENDIDDTESVTYYMNRMTSKPKGWSSDYRDCDLSPPTS